MYIGEGSEETTLGKETKEIPFSSVIIYSATEFLSNIFITAKRIKNIISRD